MENFFLTINFFILKIGISFFFNSIIYKVNKLYLLNFKKILYTNKIFLVQEKKIFVWIKQRKLIMIKLIFFL